MTKNKQINWEEEDNIIKEEENEYDEMLSKFLLKFKDIDKFLANASDVVDFYFEQQNIYHRNEYIDHLIKKINFYVLYFDMSIEDKKKNREKLEFIANFYHKLIYFGEFDPIEEEKNRLSEGVSSKIKDISWKVKKIL